MLDIKKLAVVLISYLMCFAGNVYAASERCGDTPYPPCYGSTLKVEITNKDSGKYEDGSPHVWRDYTEFSDMKGRCELFGKERLDYGKTNVYTLRPEKKEKCWWNGVFDNGCYFQN